MNFKQWLENIQLGIRYIHNDGRGLMNNSSLNYDKLNDDEYSEVEEEYLSLNQPPRNLHNQKILFVFTPEGEKKNHKLIKLLTKASKTGVKRIEVDLSNYEIVWQSNDGQLGLKDLKKENVLEIPIENIWIMHWSVNPRNTKTLDWHRKNEISNKFPSGRIGTGQEEEFGAWVRLVNDEDEEGNEIENTELPVNPNYPKIFLDDGTHRAIIALEKKQKTLKVKVTNL